MLNDTDLKAFLEEKVAVYNTFDFIENDPVCIPHRYHLKEDIEIAGFLAATISWGNRKTIVRNAIRMLDLLGESPYDFVMSCNTMQLQSLDDFVHRTFNGEDYKCFIASLKHTPCTADWKQFSINMPNPVPFSLPFTGSNNYFLKNRPLKGVKNMFQTQWPVLLQNVSTCICAGW
jgi:hypothetical protein